MSYVAEMLGGLAALAMSEGEASVAVSIQLAAVQASQAERRVRLRSASKALISD